MTLKLRAFVKTILLFTLSFSFLQAQDGRMLWEIGRQLGQSGAELLRTIEYYSEALETDPDNGAYHASRAVAYFEKGQYHEAIGDYDDAIDYYDNRGSHRMAKLYYQRGLCYYIVGDFQRAEQDFTSAIAHRPDVADAYYFRGKLLATVFDQPDKARMDFRIVMSKTQYPSVQSAFARYFMGHPDEAEQELEAMMRRVPGYDRRNYVILRYNAAGFYALNHQPRKAIEYLSEALEKGYDEYEWLVRDMNFISLAGNPDFIALLSRYGLRYQAGREYAWEPESTPRGGDDRGPVRPVNLYTSALTFSETNGNNRLDAEEVATIRFALHNDGPGTARDLTIRVKENSGVSGLYFDQEVEVGGLGVGGKREVTLEVRGDRWLTEGMADITIEVLEGMGFDAAPLQISFPTGAFAPPDMVVADHVFASERGGPMTLGVPITLRMAVQNQGRGVAEGVKVRFSLPENVYPGGANDFELGQVAPGADQTIDYEFFTNRRYTSDKVPIVVEITETSGQYSYKETFTVAINEQLEMNDRVIINANPSVIPTDPRDIQLLSDVDRNLPRAGTRNPNAIAVIIGNRDYENPDVPTVDHALQDAASMRKYLIESFGFDENNIIFLANATQADFNGTFGTKEDHRARLFNLVRENESDVFVFYSGHGAPDLATEDAYFLPSDCDPSLVRFNGYAINTLYNNLSKIPYRSLTVVVDACFSGQSDRGTLTPQASIVRIRSNNSVLKDPNAMIFTAATGAQVASWYPTQSHGLFTYYFLKGLQGDANTDRNRELTLGEMRAYLDQEVPYMARRLKNRDQTPEVYGQDEKTLLKY